MDESRPARLRAEIVTTVLLQLGDLDPNGIRNIARPFAADVEQFAIDLLGFTGTLVVDPVGAA